MNYQESKDVAVARGTEGHVTVDKSITTAIKVVGVIVVVFALTLWVASIKFGQSEYIPPAGDEYVPPAGGATNPAVPCLNQLCNVVLGPKEEVINPNGYYFYGKVDAGEVVLSGPTGELVDNGSGLGFVNQFITVSVRANGDTASMRYTLCEAPKTDMDQLNCV